MNVSPALVGLPLADPRRRAVAMLVDLVVVALLSGVSGFWLLGGLVLVVLQLRSQRGSTTRKRQVVGWLGAGLMVLLVLQAAKSDWDERPLRGAAVVTDTVAPEAKAPEADERAPPAANASPAAAASAAQARILRLEEELEQARKPWTLRQWLDRLLDDVGAKFGWGVVYFSLLPAWWSGQTVGKKLLGLQVVELTGQPMTVMRCLKRYGGYAAGLATGCLGFGQALWDPNRQAIQDKAAHTAVIDLRAERARPDANADAGTAPDPSLAAPDRH